MEELAQITNSIRENKGLSSFSQLTPEMKLREDLQFDSLDLAELTAKVEAKTGVDIFASGSALTVADIMEKTASHE